MADVWEDAIVHLDVTERRPTVYKNQITFCMPRLKVDGAVRGVAATHALQIEPKRDDMRIVFFPVALQLCGELFTRAEGIPFKTEKENHAPWTNDHEERWYVPLDKPTWRKHRDQLHNLASAVVDAWNNELRLQRLRRDRLAGDGATPLQRSLDVHGSHRSAPDRVRDQALLPGAVPQVSPRGLSPCRVRGKRQKHFDQNFLTGARDSGSGGTPCPEKRTLRVQSFGRFVLRPSPHFFVRYRQLPGKPASPLTPLHATG